MLGTMPRCSTQLSSGGLQLRPSHTSAVCMRHGAGFPTIRNLARLFLGWRAEQPGAIDLRSGSGTAGRSGKGNVGAGRPYAAVAAAAAGAPEATGGSSRLQQPRVCVLGGGFGGLYTAIKLENLLWQAGNKPKVTLVDQSERFVFKPLLYELLNGTASASEVAPPFRQLLAPYPIAFRQAAVASVEPANASQEGCSSGGGVVRLSDGGSVEYDWLVLALGSSVNTFGIPGVKEHALPFVTYDDAMKVLRALEAVEAGVSTPEVAVIGGGYSGVELAAVLAERLAGRGRVQLLTNESGILTRSSPGQREAAYDVLRQRGVAIVPHARVAAVQVEGGAAHADDQADELHSSNGVGLLRRVVQVEVSEGQGSGDAQAREIAADLVLWTAGTGPATKMGRAALPFPATERGSLQTDETLQVLQNERVFALGDVAMATPSSSGSEATYAPTAQVAFQQADYVAWNVWCSINGRSRLPFKYQHLGEIMSLGRLSAAATLPVEVPREVAESISGSPLGSLLAQAGVKLGDADDARVTLEGPLAQAARRLVYLYRQPTMEQQLRVGGEWLEEAAKVVLGAAGKVSDKSQNEPLSWQADK